MKILLTLTLLTLTGCVGTPMGSECKFWDNIPLDASQELWRDFDCPFQGQRAMFITKGPQPKL